jgi:hypothetical protein
VQVGVVTPAAPAPDATKPMSFGVAPHAPSPVDGSVPVAVEGAILATIGAC